MVSITKRIFRLAMEEFEEENKRRREFINKLKSKYPESKEIIHDIENTMFSHDFNMLFINTLNRLLEANCPCINNNTILECVVTTLNQGGTLKDFNYCVNKGFVLKDYQPHWAAPQLDLESYNDLYDYILKIANKEYIVPDFSI